jgi:hypothetical protein
VQDAQPASVGKYVKVLVRNNVKTFELMQELAWSDNNSFLIVRKKTKKERMEQCPGVRYCFEGDQEEKGRADEEFVFLGFLRHFVLTIFNFFLLFSVLSIQFINDHFLIAVTPL